MPALDRSGNFRRYLDWLSATRGLHFAGYHDVWSWSTTDIEAFWASLWEFFDVRAHHTYDAVLTSRAMPGAHWFPGSELNYAEHALRYADVAARQPALLFRSEHQPLRTMTWAELRARTASVAASLRELGIHRGDRVAACLPNIPETVIAFLACASIGAIWSSCSPDFGADGVVERFRQIEPKLLLGVDAYSYAGNVHDRHGLIEQLRRALPSVRHTVVIPYVDDATASLAHALPWSQLAARDVAPSYAPVPFEHPLWILFSSGTTGAPKAIVHGHGGILLEHLKVHALQNELVPGDRLFWHTTTGWMMWNLLVGGLLAGCTIVLYDGSPSHPDPYALWRLAQDARVTRFGAGAAYYLACMKAQLEPARMCDLGALRAIGSTGSPLPPEAFRWIYEHVKRGVWLAPSSGGTDVASAFLGPCPTLPVIDGEMQGRALGASVHAFNDDGEPVIDEVGELVVTAPMPSMPVCFWNDPDGARYRDSYFAVYPGVWRHGDWLRLGATGSAIIHGRSDATLNRHGVRFGTSEIYRVVESVDGVADSLIIGVEQPGGGYWMPLFVVLDDGVTLTEPLRERIRLAIRAALTPRHVPDDIIRIAAVPRTLNGKKLEVPIKRLLQGGGVDGAVNTAAVANPDALAFFSELAVRRATATSSTARA